MRRNGATALVFAAFLCAAGRGADPGDRKPEGVKDAWPELPPDAEARVKEIEAKVEDLWQQALDSAEAKEQGQGQEQDRALAEAIRLAEEALAIRERHQGQSREKPDQEGEWWEVADARWTVKKLRILSGLDSKDRAAWAEMERKAQEGRKLLDAGNHSSAESLIRQSLDMRPRLFKGEHPGLATSLNNLAVALQARRDFESAEPLYRQSLEMARRIFRGDHPFVAANLKNLASLLEARGSFKGAEPLYRECLDMRRRLFKGDHPDVAASFNNLALLLQARGDLQGAESLCRESLEMKRRLFKGDHPDLALSLNNMASLLQERGNFNGAEPIFRESLEMSRRTFGGDHPYVATILNNLATLLVEEGDLQAAEPLCRECLDMKRRLFKGDHPDVALTLNNLAVLLKGRGDLQGAELLYRESLDMKRRVFHGDHPDVAMSLNNLGMLLEGRGDLPSAEPLCREALEMHLRLFRRDHPAVALCLSNVAILLRGRGDLQGAERLFRQSLDIRRRLFAGDHPDVAAGLNNLAMLLQDRRDLQAAQRLFRESLDIYRRLFADDHWAVEWSLVNLALLLQARGDLLAAEPLLGDALGIAERLRTKIVGDERARAEFARELRIAGISANYASVLLRLDRPSEAFAVSERGRARSLLDLLERSALDLPTLAHERAGARSEAASRLETTLSREEKARIDLTTAEALAEGLQKERKATVALKGLESGERERRLEDLDAKIARQIEKVKDLRRGLSEAGTAVLVEMRGLFPEARALSTDEVLTALPEGDLVLGYLWSPDTIILVMAGSGESSGVIIAQDKDEMAALRELTGKVRTGIADRSLSTRIDPQDVRALFQELLPEKALARVRGARRLVVLPDGPLNDIPFEVLLASSEDEAFREKPVVYAASATVYLRSGAERGGARGKPSTRPAALVVGDCVYDRGPALEPKYPEHGALITNALPGGNAAGAGLRRGDVLLAYDGRRIDGPSALSKAIQEVGEAVEGGSRPSGDVLLRYFRGGEEREARVKPGKLGVQLSQADPASGLLSMARAARGLENLAAEVGATDQVRLFGGSLAPLPGTRREALAIAEILRRRGWEAQALLGEEATVGRLAGAAPGCRLLHLATHGLRGNAERPYDASLALTRPKEISAGDIGFLRFEDLLRGWRGKLAGNDLVVLSACETQRGVKVGESSMALPWGFFYAGARTVVASLWKVDDEATCLLMVRFYESLLGSFEQPRRVGGKTYAPGEPLPPEPALREARLWLRALTAEGAKAEGRRISSLAEAAGREAVKEEGEETTKEASRKAGEAAGKEGQEGRAEALAAEDIRAESRGSGGVVGAPLRKEDKPGKPMQPSSEARPFDQPYYWAAFVCVGSAE